MANEPNSAPHNEKNLAERDTRTPQHSEPTPPTLPPGDIHAQPDSDPSTKPSHSVTEADGRGDGTQQDHLGAPGHGGDKRTESVEDRKAAHEAQRQARIEEVSK